MYRQIKNKKIVITKKFKKSKFLSEICIPSSLTFKLKNNLKEELSSKLGIITLLGIFYNTYIIKFDIIDMVMKSERNNRWKYCLFKNSLPF